MAGLQCVFLVHKPSKTRLHSIWMCPLCFVAMGHSGWVGGYKLVWVLLIVLETCWNNFSQLKFFPCFFFVGAHMQSFVMKETAVPDVEADANRRTPCRLAFLPAPRRRVPVAFPAAACRLRPRPRGRAWRRRTVLRTCGKTPPSSCQVRPASISVVAALLVCTLLLAAMATDGAFHQQSCSGCRLLSCDLEVYLLLAVRAVC